MLTFKNSLVLTILATIFVCIGACYFSYSHWFCILPIVLFKLYFIGGVINVQWNYFVPIVSSVNTNRNHVAITFDDGPNTDHTPKVLSLLKEYNQKATFFVVGKNVENSPQMLKKIVSNGHEIGNHSYSHNLQFDFSLAKKVQTDIERCSAIIEETIEKKVSLFRPPFGITNPSLAKAVKQLNLKTIGWNIRSLDTKIRDDNELFNRVKNIKAGDIVLLHDTSDRSIVLLKSLLELLKEKDIQSVTVSELINNEINE